MTYDETVYDVTVEVIDNGDGDLVVKDPVITVKGSLPKQIEFNNSYVEPTTDNAAQTGDDFNLPLYALLMLMDITGMAAAVVRRRTNWDKE